MTLTGLGLKVNHGKCKNVLFCSVLPSTHIRPSVCVIYLSLKHECEITIKEANFYEVKYTFVNSNYIHYSY